VAKIDTHDPRAAGFETLLKLESWLRIAPWPLPEPSAVKMLAGLRRLES
jgi:hypothetical protein